MKLSGVQRQIYATIAASMSILISGMWLGWSSSASDKLMKHKAGINITYDELSWIVSMMDLGNGVSPLIAGYMMDHIGRKLSIAALGPLFIVSWSLTLFVPTTWALYMARFMAGLGKGISYTVAPVFLGEIAEVRIRGALGSVFTIQLGGGVLFEVIVGPYVSYRTLNLVSAIVPVLFFIMFLWVPESPYYLLKRGRRSDAARCLQWYRHTGDVGDELRRMEVNVRKDMESASSFRELFTNRKNFNALMVVVTACVAQRAGGVSSLTAYPALMLPEPAPVIGKFEYIILFAAVLVVINFFGLALVDRVGRKPLLIISELSLGVITFLFGLYYYLRDHMDMAAFAWWPYACYLSFSFMFGAGIGFIPVVFLGEMFPVNIRSHCSAVASITLAICSFMSNKIFLFVSNNYGYHVMFWGFAIINFGCAYYSHKNAIETTGKTFLEIQEMLEETVKDPSKKQGKQIQNDVLPA